MRAPANARYIVCRLPPRPGLLPGPRVALVMGERVHLPARTGRYISWLRKSRAIADVEIVREATPRDVELAAMGIVQ